MNNALKYVDFVKPCFRSLRYKQNYKTKLFETVYYFEKLHIIVLKLNHRERREFYCRYFMDFPKLFVVRKIHENGKIITFK